MKISWVLAAVLAIGCVALGAATLNLAQQNRELKTQLSQIVTANDPARNTSWPGGHGPLRQALEAEQEANYALRQELAQAQQAKSGQSNPPPATAAVEPAAPAGSASGETPGGWMDRIRQQDPERYKQIVAERDQRRKEMEDWYATTMSQLQARAQAPASTEEATLVTQIADTLDKLNEIRQQMQAVRQLPEDQRQAQMSQLWPEMQAAYQQLNTLREQDRTLQFQHLATQLGLKGENAQTLINIIPQIYKNTQYTPSRGAGGWGGGGNVPQSTSQPSR